MAYSHGREGIRGNAILPGHITTPAMRTVEDVAAGRLLRS